MTAQIKEGELLYHVTFIFFKFRFSILENLNKIEAKKKKFKFWWFLDFLNRFKKNSSNNFLKNSMLQYCWVLFLSNEPKHIYVGPAVTEPIDFLSRTVEFWDIAHYSQAQSGVKVTQIVTYPREISRVVLNHGVRVARAPTLGIWLLAGLRVRECVLCTYSYESGRLADLLLWECVRTYVAAVVLLK